MPADPRPDQSSPDRPMPDATVDSAPIALGPKGESWLPMALDFGPLLIFFAATKFIGMFVGTAVFMVAILFAVIVSKWRLGRVSPMLWLSAILVLFFGGLTLYFHDEKFIQIKPTIIYSFFALMLVGGWMRGKPLMRYLLQSAYQGLNDIGWLKLSRNWGLFFAGMAITNEILRAMLDFDSWLTVKVWGITLISLVFAMANVPMLMKHGLSVGDDKKTDKTAD